MVQDSAGRREPGGRASATLAEKLTRLYELAGLESDRQASAAIKKETGEEISFNTLYRYRTGDQDNPTKKTLETLATFFKVPVAYFFDDEAAERIDQQLELLTLLRDGQIGRSHLRSLGELSPEGRTMIADMIQSVARMERQRRGGSQPN